MLFEDYKPIHGDPSRNGLGHQRMNVKGKDIVVFLATDMGTIVVSDAELHEYRKELANDETDPFGDEALSGQFAAMSAELGMPSVTQESETLPPVTPRKPVKRSATTSPSPSPHHQQSSQPSSSSGSGGIGLSVVLASTTIPHNPLTEQTLDEECSTNKRKATGSGASSQAKDAKKAKAKGKAGGSSARAVGRPTRDLLQAAETALTNLRESGESTDMCIGSMKVHTKEFRRRLVADLKAATDSATEVEQHGKYEATHRRMSAAYSAFAVAASKGTVHTEFRKVYDDALELLKNHPAQHPDFPVHWRMAQYESLVQDDMPALHFWELLDIKAFTDLGMADSIRGVTFQEQLVCTKIIASTRDPTTIEAKMTALFKNLEWTPYVTESKLITDLYVLHELANADTHPTDKLERAVQLVLDAAGKDDHNILAAVSTFTSGQAWLKHIGQYTKNRVVAGAFINEWSACLLQHSSYVVAALGVDSYNDVPSLSKVVHNLKGLSDMSQRVAGIPSIKDEIMALKAYIHALRGLTLRYCIKSWLHLFTLAGPQEINGQLLAAFKTLRNLPLEAGLLDSEDNVPMDEVAEYCISLSAELLRIHAIIDVDSLTREEQSLAIMLVGTPQSAAMSIKELIGDDRLHAKFLTWFNQNYVKDFPAKGNESLQRSVIPLAVAVKERMEQMIGKKLVVEDGNTIAAAALVERFAINDEFSEKLASMQQLAGGLPDEKLVNQCICLKHVTTLYSAGAKIVQWLHNNTSVTARRCNVHSLLFELVKELQKKARTCTAFHESAVKDSLELFKKKEEDTAHPIDVLDGAIDGGQMLSDAISQVNLLLRHI